MEAEYVGVDLHRRRSVIVRKTHAGETVETVHITNDPLALAEVIGRAGESPEVVLEATYGWYWAADVLAEAGARVHLAHPLGNAWGNRRVKNDERDAGDLVDLLRLGRLAEADIAPPGLRQLRELVRYRAKLVAVRSGLKAQVHAVLAKEGVTVTVADCFGLAGRAFLAGLALAGAYRARVDSLLELIDAFDEQVATFETEVAHALAGHPGYLAVQAIPGVGPILAAIFVAEIGDAARFPGPAQLCSWAGLTPRHRESDIHVHRGHITKQGSKLVRWAAIGPSAANAAPRPSDSRITASPSGEARPASAGSPRRASCSPSSTTACATATSAPWPNRPGETLPAQPARELAICHDPRHTPAWSPA